MPTFQVSLRGHDQTNPLCDHLIKTIWAPDEGVFNKWLLENGIRMLVDAPLDDNIFLRTDLPDEGDHFDKLSVLLCESGKAIKGQYHWLYWLHQINLAKTPANNVYEGKIEGEHKEEFVYLNGKRLDHRPSLKIVNHSPDGFSWGYMGSGPAQLALAILLEETGDVEFSVQEHNDFMRHHIATHERQGRFYMTSERVRKFFYDQGRKYEGMALALQRLEEEGRMAGPMAANLNREQVTERLVESFFDRLDSAVPPTVDGRESVQTSFLREAHTRNDSYAWGLVEMTSAMLQSINGGYMADYSRMLGEAALVFVTARLDDDDVQIPDRHANRALARRLLGLPAE